MQNNSLQAKIEQEVEGRVRDDHQVREIVNLAQPPRPDVLAGEVVHVAEAVPGLVDGGQQFPHVREDVRSDQDDGDPGQPLLLRARLVHIPLRRVPGLERLPGLGVHPGGVSGIGVDFRRPVADDDGGAPGRDRGGCRQ